MKLPLSSFFFSIFLFKFLPKFLLLALVINSDIIGGEVIRKLPKVKQNIVLQKKQNYITYKWGFCNSDGELVIKQIWDKTKHFHDGLAGVRKDEKWGYINKKDEIVIAPQYDYVGGFNEGISAVQIGEKWAFIDTNNKILREFKDYDFMYDMYFGGYYMGMIKVKKRNKWGVINKKGQILVPFDYDQISYAVTEEIVELKKGNLSGICDIYGKERVACEYRSLTRLRIDGSLFGGNRAMKEFVYFDEIKEAFEDLKSSPNMNELVYFLGDLKKAKSINILIEIYL